MGKLAASSNL
jgi:hypothetical protein